VRHKVQTGVLLTVITQSNHYVSAANTSDKNHHSKKHTSLTRTDHLHFTPPHSPWHHLLTTIAPQMSKWLSSGRCWLLS